MDTKESLTQAILDKVRLGVTYYEDRFLRNWMDMGRLLSKLDALDNTYRIVGGPKDGERIAIEPGRNAMYMPKAEPLMSFREAFANAKPESSDFKPASEMLTYHLLTNRRTGERALVLEGLEGW